MHWASRGPTAAWLLTSCSCGTHPRAIPRRAIPCVTRSANFRLGPPPDLRFRTLSWQQLADRLDDAADAKHQAFLSQLRARYLA